MPIPDRIKITLPQLKSLCELVKEILDNNDEHPLVAYGVFDDGSVGINLHFLREEKCTGLENMNLILDD